jgi:hypothetical protein
LSRNGSFRFCPTFEPNQSKRRPSLLTDFVEEVGFGGDFGALAFIMRFDGRAS